MSEIPPFCPYFFLCGGCDNQNVSYSEQVAWKNRQLEGIFAPVTDRYPNATFLPYIGSPDAVPMRYRNKIRFSFIESDGAIHPARHKKGDEKADIPVTACYIASSLTENIINTTARVATELKWEPYNPATKSGWLRHILVRHASRTNEVLIGLVTGIKPPEKGELDFFINEVTSLDPAIVSVRHLVDHDRGVGPLEEHHLYGKSYIRDRIGPYTCIVSAQAFFQTNDQMVETLYQSICQAAGSGTTCWDLYAGSSTIGMWLSSEYSRVISIESNPANIQDAKANIEQNSLTNIQVIEGLVERVVDSTFLQETGTPDCIIVDPPRAGLHPRARQVISHIAKQTRARVVYVSCNPVTAVRDILEMSENGLPVTSIQGIDMFPHTLHTECVTVIN